MFHLIERRNSLLSYLRYKINCTYEFLMPKFVFSFFVVVVVVVVFFFRGGCFFFFADFFPQILSCQNSDDFSF